MPSGSLHLIFAIVAGLAGYLLPGYYIARVLRAKSPWCAGFIVSLLLLFHSVLWLGDAGVFVTVSVIGWVLVGVTLAGQLALKWQARAEARRGASATAMGGRALFEFGRLMSAWPERVLAIGIAIILAAVTAKYMAVPLTGFDTVWRWDFLPRILELQGNLKFYPLHNNEGFRLYPWFDGQAPIVSVGYWWTYSLLGEHVTRMTFLLVMLQVLVLGTLIFRLAHAMTASTRAGLWAAAVAAVTPVLLQAVTLGQETGLSALGVVATAYFIYTADDRSDWRAAVLAGLAASLAALTREYGPAFVLCGLFMALARRMSPRFIFVFCLVTIGVAASWNLRSWWLCGNPFGTIDVMGLFPVNARANSAFARAQSHSAWRYHGWDWVIFFMALTSAGIFPAAAGATVMMRRWRTWLWLAVPAIIGVLLYLESIGNTNSFRTYSARVMSPSLALAAGALGVGLSAWLAQRKRERAWSAGAACVFLACVAWSLPNIVTNPFCAAMVPMSQWSANFKARPNWVEGPRHLAPAIAARVPAGLAIVVDCYHFPALWDQHASVITSISPEVDFLYDPGLPIERVLQIAQGKKIGAVMLGLEPETNVAKFVREHPGILPVRDQFVQLCIDAPGHGTTPTPATR